MKGNLLLANLILAITLFCVAQATDIITLILFLYLVASVYFVRFKYKDVYKSLLLFNQWVDKMLEKLENK